MSTNTMRDRQPAAQPQAQQLDGQAAFEEILAATKTPRYVYVDEALHTRIDKVEQALPAFMKGQGERLVMRAMLTFARRKELEECTPGSFIRCVLDAAELGLAIDGRLAHAVPFNNKVKDKKTNKEEWRKEAQLIVDYKGLVAVAKRTKQIRDIDADVVCESDEYEAYKVNGGSHLRHKKPLAGRGKVLGAYARIILPDGSWRFEEMSLEELGKVRASSKAGQSGPWVNWFEEMCKKTVVRRTLKMYCDDPGLIRLFEIEDSDFSEEVIAETVSQAATKPPVGRTHLRNGKTPSPLPAETSSAPEDNPRDDQPPDQDAGQGQQSLDEEDMSRNDLINDFRDRVKAAEDLGTIQTILGELTACQEKVGPALAELRTLAGEKTSIIQGKTLRKGGK